jgi:hypothetical protein
MSGLATVRQLNDRTEGTPPDADPYDKSRPGRLMSFDVFVLLPIGAATKGRS